MQCPLTCLGRAAGCERAAAGGQRRAGRHARVLCAHVHRAERHAGAPAALCPSRHLIEKRMFNTGLGLPADVCIKGFLSLRTHAGPSSMHPCVCLNVCFELPALVSVERELEQADLL